MKDDKKELLKKVSYLDKLVSEFWNETTVLLQKAKKELDIALKNNLSASYYNRISKEIQSAASQWHYFLGIISTNQFKIYNDANFDNFKQYMKQFSETRNKYKIEIDRLEKELQSIDNNFNAYNKSTYSSLRNKIKMTQDCNNITDEASEDTTISALIADEHAAIDAYRVAIENLKGKVSDKAIAVLEHILEEEEEHVKELQSIEEDDEEEVDITEDDCKIRDYDKHKIMQYLNKLVNPIGLHAERQISNDKYLLKPNHSWDYNMADKVRDILGSRGHDVIVIAPEVYVTLNAAVR